jgi:hypothetical protein
MSATGCLLPQVEVNDVCIIRIGQVLRFRRRLPLAQTFSGALDPVGVVDDSVENGVGERRDDNHIVPAIDGNLAGDDEGALVVAVLDDFEEIAGLIGRQGFRPPIVEDER